jgi:hypothetical protein
MKISKEKNIIDTIKKRKLRLFGHIYRMDDNRLIKHTIFAKNERKIPTRTSMQGVAG